MKEKFNELMESMSNQEGGEMEVVAWRTDSGIKGMRWAACEKDQEENGGYGYGDTKEEAIQEFIDNQD